MLISLDGLSYVVVVCERYVFVCLFNYWNDANEYIYRVAQRKLDTLALGNNFGYVKKRPEKSSLD